MRGKLKMNSGASSCLRSNINQRNLWVIKVSRGRNINTPVLGSPHEDLNSIMKTRKLSKQGWDKVLDMYQT